MEDSELEEYQAHRENYDGFCVECGDWTRIGDTEPDAENYECPACEKNACMGAEVWLIEQL